MRAQTTNLATYPSSLKWLISSTGARGAPHVGPKSVELARVIPVEGLLLLYADCVYGF